MKETIENKYRKVLLAAQRTKQLQNGARPRLRAPGTRPTRIALAEIEQGLIGFFLGPEITKNK
jgi:DNA-directed RNA polymerase omega subunit